MNEWQMNRGLGQRATEGEAEPSISAAWRYLARLGLPYRYGGKAPDGLYEFLIIDPASGAMITSGKGATVARAMVAAAGAGRRLAQDT